MSERYWKLCGERNLERSSDHSQRQKVGVVIFVLECSQSPQIPFRSEESRYADQAELHWLRIYILSLLIASCYQTPASQQKLGTSSHPPRIIGRIVEMGFSTGLGVGGCKH